MTAYERLMAEAIPTGTFGRARPAQRRDDSPRPAWTAEEQAAHRAELEAALTPSRPSKPKLRVIHRPARRLTALPAV